jgi:hypothetical protein
LGRFISRDPKKYIDGMSMYRGYFAPNGVDPTGNNVYIIRTDAANGLHHSICVDVWDECCENVTGRFCISFGMDMENPVVKGGLSSASGAGGLGSYSTSKGASSSNPSATTAGTAAGTASTSTQITVEHTADDNSPDGSTGSGVVYVDTDPIREIVDIVSTNCAMDKALLWMFRKQVNTRGTYGADATCRTFSAIIMGQARESLPTMEKLGKMIIDQSDCDDCDCYENSAPVPEVQTVSE